MFFPSSHAFVIVTAFVIVPIPPRSHHAVYLVLVSFTDVVQDLATLSDTSYS